MNRTGQQPLRGKTSPTTQRGHARANEILAAAQAIFVRDGYAGFSVRSVAASVGIGLSTLQHYYPSKDHLLEAMWLFLMDRYQAAIDEVIEAMPEASQLERFLAAMKMFVKLARDPATARILVHLAAAALTDPVAARTMQKLQRRERKTIAELIRGIAPAISDAELEARAALIVAQLQGLVMRNVGSQGASRAASAILDQSALASFQWLATGGPAIDDTAG
ncbi:TetR/AcrR family transcriptional regulator [Paraburkholderia pallida]|uniref:TetR/AcrR family transcriptional regulator n=1 Tax=Paraburkholderia pallida TaxID=2547399 RepID=A0A4V1AZI1_9BURK|nr:TetR/AcrR family transcriptional regulator [Paraburkholderia pallida]QBQ99352.1 TetR/AcrR family transcriptional regulator [Paraburkholderia pallida]